MRPPEFTGGNQRQSGNGAGVDLGASMRPPEFTGGNFVIKHETAFYELGFNEAAGIHRRKLGSSVPIGIGIYGASMRPPEFTGGNERDRAKISSPGRLLQ